MIRFKKAVMPLCEMDMHDDCPRLQAEGRGTTDGVRCTCRCHAKQPRAGLLEALQDHIAQQGK